MASRLDKETPYHLLPAYRHPINQLIHFVFVPTILWTVLVWLAQLWPGAGPVPLGAVGDLLPDALRP